MWGYSGVQKYVVEVGRWYCFQFSKNVRVFLIQNGIQTNLNRFSLVWQKFQLLILHLLFIMDRRNLSFHSGGGDLIMKI